MQDLRVAVEKPKTLKPKKEFIVVLTDTNCLKRIEVSKFRATEEDSKNIKVEGNQKVTLVSDKGNMYKVMSNKIDICLPTASGMDIATLRPEIGDEHIIAIYDENVTIPYVVMVTEQGRIKKIKVDISLNASKQVGLNIFKIDEKDHIKWIKLVNDTDKIEVTTNLRTFQLETGHAQGRNAGGRAINQLRKKEVITDIHSVD